MRTAMRAAIVVCLPLLLPHASARADDGQARVAAIGDMEAARLQAASHLAASLTGISLSRGWRLDKPIFTLPKEMPADAVLTDLEARQATSERALRQGDKWYLGQWICTGPGPVKSDTISLIYESAGQRQALFLDPSDPGSGLEVRASGPRDSDHAWQLYLGLSWMDGTCLSSKLKGPATVTEGQKLRGANCTLLETPNAQLWLSADHGYAPLRLVQRYPEQHQTIVDDWFRHDAHGSLHLPSAFVMRSFILRNGVLQCEGLRVVSIADIKVGQAEVAGVAAAWDWKVPVLPGVGVYNDGTMKGPRYYRVGQSPRTTFLLATDAKSPMTGYIRRLAEDTGLALPASDAEEQI